MLGEPKTTSFDLRFVLLGIAVRIHPGFWAMGAFLGFNMRLQTPPLVLVFMAAVFLSILVHEMGHALAFRHCRIRAHVVLYHFGGLAVPTAMESYVDHTSGFTSKQKLFVTAAGPGLQIFLTLLLVLGLRGMGKTDGFLTREVGIPAPLTADPSLLLEEVLATPNLIQACWKLEDLKDLNEQNQERLADVDIDKNQWVTDDELSRYYRVSPNQRRELEDVLSKIKDRTRLYVPTDKKKRFVGKQRELFEAADFREDGLIMVSDLQRIHSRNVNIQNEPLREFVLALVRVGTFWALLNLIPIYPLDGGQISRELFVLSGTRDAVPKSLKLSVAAGVGVGIWGMMNGYVFLAMMFFMLAWSSYQVLQKYQRGY